MRPTLTSSQAIAIGKFEEFLPSDNHAFVLTGPAGTGKTFLLREIAQRVAARRLTAAFVAPTGRAARVLGGRLGTESASTVHSLIYAFDHLEDEHRADGTRNEADIRFRFALKDSGKLDAQVIVVDEASMVGDRDSSDPVLQFGSGRLLHDLLRYVFYGSPPRSARKIVFVGDPFQLPPVGDPASPALDLAYLRDEYGIRAVAATLDEVVRQEAGSGVLDLADDVRTSLEASRHTTLRLRKPVAGVELVEPEHLTDAFLHELDTEGTEQCLMIVRSNERALRHNRIVRERTHGRADCPPQPGDRIVVAQNNHLHGLFNGQFGVIESSSETPEIKRVGCLSSRMRRSAVEFSEQPPLSWAC